MRSSPRKMIGSTSRKQSLKQILKERLGIESLKDLKLKSTLGSQFESQINGLSRKEKSIEKEIR